MPRRLLAPVVLPASGPVRFPDPTRFDAEGLVAIGGDLRPETLLAAYGSGIFPWYAEGYVPMWWSPDPRALLDPAHLHIARSLKKRLAKADYRLTWNRCFARVMRECGRLRKEGTWIIPEMLAAYTRLHELGRAHSLEVWLGDDLVAGTYGVQVGCLFAAESMFHRRTDMSKVALVALVRSLFAAGIGLLDVQFATGHLTSLGAFTIPRAEYLARIGVLVASALDLTKMVPAVDALPDSPRRASAGGAKCE